MIPVFRIFSAIAAVLPIGAVATASSPEDVAAVERARAVLQRQLESTDAVIVKSERAQTPSPPSALRDFDSAHCLPAASLAESEKALGADRAAGLDRLRQVLLSEQGANRQHSELALARGYLVLGFVEEARAIAAARTGPEAAAIAALSYLAEGDGEKAAQAITAARACGGLYDFIAEAASSLNEDQRPPSKQAVATLTALPTALRRSIADALAVKALVVSDDVAAAYNALAGEPAGGPTSEAAALLHAALDVPDKRAAGSTFALIAGSPGPLRGHALREFSERIDDETPAAIVAAIDDSIVEESATGPSSPSLAALNLSLANRRLDHGDYAGAVRALVNASHHEATRNEAQMRFRSLAQTLIGSEDSEIRFQALGLLAANPDLSGESMEDGAARFAAARFSDLGAPDALARLSPRMKLPAEDKAYWQARALLRAGQRTKAQAIAQPYAGTPRFAELLYSCTSQGEEMSPDIKRTLQGAMTADAYAALLWYRGDLAGLRALAEAAPKDARTAERLILAHVAAGKTPPRAAVSALGEPAATPPFAPARRIDQAGSAALRQFVEALRWENRFLRGALNNE